MVLLRMLFSWLWRWWPLDWVAKSVFFIMSTEKKKKAQCESCELSFIGGQNEDYSLEPTSPIVLGICSEELSGEAVYM